MRASLLSIFIAALGFLHLFQPLTVTPPAAPTRATAVAPVHSVPPIVTATAIVAPIVARMRTASAPPANRASTLLPATGAAPNYAGLVLGASTPSSPYITQDDLTAQLQSGINNLRSLIYSNTSGGAASQVAQGQYASGGYTNEIALSNKIDQLNGTTLNNVIVNGISRITAANVPALQNYLLLAGGTLTGAFADAATASSSFAGALGIGTSSPSDTLAVNGPIFLADVSPAPTTNRLYSNSGSLYWSGNLLGGGSVGNWTSDGTNVWRTGGNVGIGTSSPGSILSVQGVANFTTATSTFYGSALNLTAGCFAVNGTCIGGTPGITTFPAAVGTYPDTGTPSTFATVGGSPNSLAFDTLGNLYVANYGSNSVSKITPGGTVTTIPNIGISPSALAFDSAGNLYVVVESGNAVYKITPSGTVSTFASGLNQPTSLAFDTSGNLYVTNFGGGTISKITPGGTVSTFATVGTNPNSLAFDTSGNLYVANEGSKSISKITPSGTVSIFATIGNDPLSLVFDTSGNLYVANNGDSTVSKISGVANPTPVLTKLANATTFSNNLTVSGTTTLASSLLVFGTTTLSTLSIQGNGYVLGNLSDIGQTLSGGFRIGNSSTTPTVVYVGDSLTLGSGGTHPYNFYITLPTYNGISFTSYNIGISGETLQTMNSAAPSNLNPLFAYNAPENIAFIWGGTNDIGSKGASAAQTFSYLQNLAQHERQLGFKIIVLTMTSRPGLDGTRDPFNSLIRSNWPQFADGLADVAANPNLGADGAYSNATYFQSDHVHLTDTGYALVGSIVQAAIKSLVTGSTNNISTVGNVGIGTTTPYSRLTVWGADTASTSPFAVVNSASTTVFAVYDNGNATYSGSIFQSSDQRLKTNVQPLDASSSLSLIGALNPVSYTRLDQTAQGMNLGFIAQQVQQLFPELVSTTSPTALTPDGTLTLNYVGLISPIVAAIQALMHQFTSLEATVAGFADNFVSAHITVTTGDFQQVNTQKLCVTDAPGDPTPVCVTKAQLAALLAEGASGGDQSPATAQPGPAGTSTLPGSSVTQNGAASTTPGTPPVIQINGDNPAIIHVGDSYADLGATITGPQADLNLGIKTFLNGRPVSNIVIDTSSVATDTIDYVATDSAGLTSTSTRIVIVQAANAPSIVPTDDASSTGTTTAQ